MVRTIRVWSYRTRMVYKIVPYAYGTYHTRMVCTIRVRYKIRVWYRTVTVNDIARAINDNKQVDAAILDFSKVFDKVAHLIYKLDYYGIRGILLNWLTSFLQNRSQEVVVESMNSSSCNVISGVPQGSVLGPVLFLMYVNDIGLNIHGEIRLFADDILLYQPIRTTRRLKYVN